MREDSLRDWFCREVLPLEPALTRYLQRNWRRSAEVVDLRQDIYVRAYQAATVQPPLNTRAFLFAIARNHLIDVARRARIVSMNLVVELEATSMDEFASPERIVSARDELRLVRGWLERLPRRCRQVIELRRIHGMSQKETAEHLNVSVKAVEQQMAKGMRILANQMLAHDPDAGCVAGGIVNSVLKIKGRSR